MDYRRLREEDLAQVLQLFAAEGYDTYVNDPATALTAFQSPGSTSYVALDGADVVGFVQIQSDGHIQAHLTMIVTHREYRRRGVARALLRAAFAESGAARLDVLSEVGSERFYESFLHKKGVGYRIYPQEK